MKEQDHEHAALTIIVDALRALDPESRKRIMRYCIDRFLPRESVQAKGGRARAASLSPERRSSIAKTAADQRWTSNKSS